MPYTVPTIYMQSVNNNYRSWPASPTNLQASVGNFSFNGQTINIHPDRRIFGDVGNILLNGQNINLAYSGYDPYVGRSPAAGDIYVAASGNDSNTGTSQSSPRSATISASTLSLANSPGRYLWLVGAGPFTFPSFITNLKGSSAGGYVEIAALTPLQPVVNIPSGSVQIDSGTNTQYIRFRGLTVNCVDTGFWMGQNVGASNIDFIDCALNASGGGDNVGPVMYQSGVADDRTRYGNIIRCTFQGAGSGVHQNTAGVMVLRAKNINVLGCYFNNIQCGVYFKFTDNATNTLDSMLLKNNIFNNVYRWVNIESNYARIINNVFCNATKIKIGEAAGANGGMNGIYTNNTFFNTGWEWATQTGTPNTGTQNETFLSNLFVGTVNINAYPTPTTAPAPSISSADYNGYPTGNFIVWNPNSYALAGWKAFSGLDIHSLAGVPTFVGGSNPTPNIPSGWALMAGSFGQGAGQGGVDMGVDATKLLTVN